MLDPLLERLDVAVHHRRRRRDPQPVRVAHDAEPLVRGRLLRRDDLADAVDEDLRAAAGERVEARVAQAREGLRDRQLGAARDVLHLGRRERVQVDRVALLDRAEEILVELDPEIGVVAALHEERGAAEGERLLDLLEDDRLRQQVALAAVARAAVEGAEVAVGVADVRVVQVPVDDERHAVGLGLAGAQLVGGAADLDEVARAQELDRLVVGDPLAGERSVEDFGDAHAGTGSVTTNLSSGTRSSWPASRASSKKVRSPARSRGPKR